MNIYKLRLKESNKKFIENVSEEILEMFENNALYWMGDGDGGLFLFNKENLVDLINDIKEFGDNANLIRILEKDLEKLETETPDLIFYILI